MLAWTVLPGNTGATKLLNRRTRPATGLWGNILDIPLNSSDLLPIRSVLLGPWPGRQEMAGPGSFFISISSGSHGMRAIVPSDGASVGLHLFTRNDWLISAGTFGPGQCFKDVGLAEARSRRGLQAP